MTYLSNAKGLGELEKAVPRRCGATNCAATSSSAPFRNPQPLRPRSYNDVQCVQYMLKNRFGFTDQQIIILRDDQRHPDFYPTRANIFRSLAWLAMDQQPGARTSIGHSRTARHWRSCDVVRGTLRRGAAVRR
jgi:hypothetical protein